MISDTPAFNPARRSQRTAAKPISYNYKVRAKPPPKLQPVSGSKSSPTLAELSPTVSEPVSKPPTEVRTAAVSAAGLSFLSPVPSTPRPTKESKQPTQSAAKCAKRCRTEAVASSSRSTELPVPLTSVSPITQAPTAVGAETPDITQPMIKRAYHHTRSTALRPAPAPQSLASPTTQASTTEAPMTTKTPEITWDSENARPRITRAYLRKHAAAHSTPRLLAPEATTPGTEPAPTSLKIKRAYHRRLKVPVLTSTPRDNNTIEFTSGESSLASPDLADASASSMSATTSPGTATAPSSNRPAFTSPEVTMASGSGIPTSSISEIVEPAPKTPRRKRTLASCGIFSDTDPSPLFPPQPAPNKCTHLGIPSTPPTLPTPNRVSPVLSKQRFLSHHEAPSQEGSTAPSREEGEEPFVPPPWMLEPNVAPAMLKLLERAKGYYDDIRNPLTNPVGIRYLDVNPKAWQTFAATPFFTSRVEAIEKALTPEQRVNNDIVLVAREVCRRLWCNIVYANGQFGAGDFWNRLKGEPVKPSSGME